ncbi:MAG: glucosaminidase domain-containing protein [Myroides sp.]|jgi:flagellum-specific peptidoglycan hydrolase FlgJ|nr:glucosaminidase domain-containing protein [Myroides sp.]
MKKLVTLLFTGFILMSCSAAHNAKVKEKIAQEYGDGDKKKKVTVKTRSEIEKDKTPIVASKTISEKPNKPLLNKSETETLVATSTITTTKNTIEDYITLYAPLAVESMKNYGIPASIKLAQGILESGSGNGTLCRTANNHFGIKCKEEWTGESVAHTDDAPDECFRKYPSALDSYNDHSEFLANRSFYRNLFTLDKSDYKAWANGLKKAGYATDPRYPQKLISIIERYKLYEYDRIALNSGYVPVTSVVAVNSSATVTQDYVVQPGDTLFAISQKFNSSIDRIRALNNLSGNTISVGQRLIVQ